MNVPESELERLSQVLARVLDAIRENRTIKLPVFDPRANLPTADYALQSVGIEPNDFGGYLGEYRYQFEGEEDLLHLMIFRRNGKKLSPEEGQALVSTILEGVPPAMIWLKPGEYSQHFYFGHDELLNRG